MQRLAFDYLSIDYRALNLRSPFYRLRALYALPVADADWRL